MLRAGVLVSRTDSDLVRYHGKILIVDRRRAYILGFNFTADDLDSRSFGVVVRTRRIVDELLRLFDCDATRSNFIPRIRDLVVSPENARARLGGFLRKARKTIDIYDPHASDDEMLGILRDRVRKGVRVRLVGKLEDKWLKAGFDARPFPGRRLHVRAMIRDGRRAFVGSQSLRKLELDRRREVGIFIRDGAVVRKLAKTFRRDWRRTRPARQTRAA